VYRPLKSTLEAFRSFTARTLVHHDKCRRGGHPFAHTEADLRDIFQKFCADQSGATAIEYGLIAAGIALAIIAVVNGLGSTLNTNFGSINSSLK
jgi:pilus assembly protein Flp/PilA